MILKRWKTHYSKKLKGREGRYYSNEKYPKLCGVDNDSPVTGEERRVTCRNCLNKLGKGAKN